MVSKMSDGPFTRYEALSKDITARFWAGAALMAIVLFGGLILGFFFLFSDHLWYAVATLVTVLVLGKVLPRPMAWVVTLGRKNDK